MKQLIAALMLAALIAGPVHAQSASTPLGEWAQRMGTTAQGMYIGCDVQPPHSTRCWEAVVTKAGQHIATRHYRQMPGGSIATWLSRP